MKAIAIFLLFIGMFLVVQGYYSNNNGGLTSCPAPEVQIKYVPRSIYQEQMAPDNQNIVSKQFQSMFENIQPWPGVQQNINNSTSTAANYVSQNITSSIGAGS